MSTIVTQTAQYANTTLPDRPQDGETIYMDAGVAPQWPLWSRLYDRTAHHEGALFGHLSWSGDLSVDPGGSNSSFTIRLGAINAVNIYGASASKVFAYAGGTIGASKIQGGGNLANSDWYHVYAYNNAGSIDFEISTTEPNASRTLKTGDSTRGYLGCFPTLSTGAPVPLRASRGRYVYRVSGCGADDLKVLNGLSDTSYTAVDCAALLPAHARLGSFRANIVSTTGSAQNFAYFQTNADSGADAVQLHVEAVNASSDDLFFDLETDSSQRLQYKVTNNTSAPDAYLYVHGFYE